MFEAVVGVVVILFTVRALKGPGAFRAIVAAVSKANLKFASASYGALLAIANGFVAYQSLLRSNPLGVCCLLIVIGAFVKYYRRKTSITLRIQRRGRRFVGKSSTRLVSYFVCSHNSCLPRTFRCNLNCLSVLFLGSQARLSSLHRRSW